jgi:hypothetical protein
MYAYDNVGSLTFAEVWQCLHAIRNGVGNTTLDRRWLCRLIGIQLTTLEQVSNFTGQFTFPYRPIFNSIHFISIHFDSVHLNSSSVAYPIGSAYNIRYPMWVLPHESRGQPRVNVLVQDFGRQDFWTFNYILQVLPTEKLLQPILLF